MIEPASKNYIATQLPVTRKALFISLVINNIEKQGSQNKLFDTLRLLIELFPFRRLQHFFNMNKVFVQSRLNNYANATLRPSSFRLVVICSKQMLCHFQQNSTSCCIRTITCNKMTGCYSKQHLKLEFPPYCVKFGITIKNCTDKQVSSNLMKETCNFGFCKVCFDDFRSYMTQFFSLQKQLSASDMNLLVKI